MTDSSTSLPSPPAPPREEQPPAANAASSASSIPKTKKIYLIRHAESEENRRIAALSRTFCHLKRFTLPKPGDASAATELLNVSAQVDSSVSEIGVRQIAHMGEKLRNDNFVETSGIELVVHSPLSRARRTSRGMLGCSCCGEGREEETKFGGVSRVTETDLLLEKTPAEWTPLFHDQFLQRISDFETWLGQQPERVVAIVGHSQHFKSMLGLDYKFGNCEVWKVDFATPAEEETTTTTTKTEAPSSRCWSNLEKVYGCEIESSPKTV